MKSYFSYGTHGKKQLNNDLYYFEGLPYYNYLTIVEYTPKNPIGRSPVVPAIWESPKVWSCGGRLGLGLGPKLSGLRGVRIQGSGSSLGFKV